jgi:hypothetical protein
MGASQSASFGRYTNDFELIVRAAKELEELLEKHFGAPDGKDQGLHDKISAARVKGAPLPEPLVRKLRYLVTIRNKLIHEYDFNSIPERAAFVKSFDEVHAELLKLASVPAGNQGCAIM